MKRRLLRLLLMLFLVVQGTYFAPTTFANPETKGKTYLVGLKKETNADSFIEIKGLKEKNPKRVKNINTLVVQLNESELQTLQSDAEVTFVEEDASVQVAAYGEMDSNHETVKKMKKDSETVPWGIHDIGVEQALEQNVDGKSVNIAVLDTGIANHPDLRVVGGVSFVEGTTEYIDDNGHGTHVAGTIAATNNKMGVIGAASKSNVYAVKVLDQNGLGSYSQVIQGIEWAMENKMDIISISFGGVNKSEALHQAVKGATERGVLVIAAAGNRGSGEEMILYPAQYPEVISVGAVNQSHQRAHFSSTGSELDLVAPGVDILSTILNGQYGVMSGTSMAVPHVTGAVAVVWSVNKNLPASEIKKKLLQTATRLGDPNEYGYGLINLTNTLGLKDESSLTTPSVPPQESTNGLTDSTFFEINKIDAELLEVSNNLSSFVNKALSLENLNLAKEIEQKNYELIIKNLELHRLPEELSSPEENKRLENIQPQIDQYLSTKVNDYKKLKGSYEEIIVEYSNKLGVEEEPITNPTQKNVSAQATTELYYNTPIDINTPPGAIIIFRYTPIKSGVHSIYTGPFGGTGTSSSDTYLELFTDEGLTNKIAFNNNANGSVFSKIDANLTAGTSYYIKLRHVNYGPIYARLLATDTPVLELNRYSDVDLPGGFSQVYLFKPTSTGPYRIYTGPFGGSGSSNDTVLELYSDANLTNLISSNDDVYSTLFSEIKPTLIGGTSYYIKIRHYNSTTPVHARLSIVPYVFPVNILLKSPVDIDLPAGQHKLFKFIPSKSDYYWVYTDYYGGMISNGQSDTTLTISKYENMNYQLNYNDNRYTNKFSQIIQYMDVGSTYYIKLEGYNNGNVRARFSLEVSGYQYTYDQAGRLTGVRTPDGKHISYTYDNNGNLIQKIRTPQFDFVTQFNY